MSLLTSAATRNEFHLDAVGVLQAVLDERNGQLRHVNADPVAAEFLGGNRLTFAQILKITRLRIQHLVEQLFDPGQNVQTALVGAQPSQFQALQILRLESRLQP